MNSVDWRGLVFKQQFRVPQDHLIQILALLLDWFQWVRSPVFNTTWSDSGAPRHAEEGGVFRQTG